MQNKEFPPLWSFMDFRIPFEQEDLEILQRRKTGFDLKNQEATGEDPGLYSCWKIELSKCRWIEFSEGMQRKTQPRIKKVPKARTEKLAK
jgi:hypothetical protein